MKQGRKKKSKAFKTSLKYDATLKVDGSFEDVLKAFLTGKPKGNQSPPVKKG